MEPIKLIQTRLHKGALPHERGNCYPAVIACFMHKDVEDVFQVQEHYDIDAWYELFDDWIDEQGWELGSLSTHPEDDSYYLISGMSPRNRSINHICIYHKGKLYHDPHPDGSGILTEERFQYLKKVS